MSTDQNRNSNNDDAQRFVDALRKVLLDYEFGQYHEDVPRGWLAGLVRQNLIEFLAIADEVYGPVEPPESV